MATSGNKGVRRKLPAAATQSIPTTAAHVDPMTAEEAAPALEAAHDAADIAAAPLVASADLVSAPITIIEATAADEDKTMDMNATIQNTAEKTTEQAQAMFADVQDRTKGAVEKGQKFFAELTEFNKGNIEALVESSKIAVRGIEAMGQDAMATAKSSFEDASQAVQTLATVKSPTEFMRLQADFARSAFDALVQQTSRRTEASLKLAGEIAQPISNRVALAAEKIKIAA
jgi:phasin family protein